MKNFNRTQILAIATVVLLLGAVAYHIYAGWGLITIHAKGEPLSKVIASMARQGHATIQTDISGDTPVTMDVVKVHLPDALETLATVTNSRWRLLYFIAGDKATLKTGETAWLNSTPGQHPDGWTMLAFPLGNLVQADDDMPVLDPRQDSWTPQAAAPGPVQTFLSEAAQLTNAGFAFPTDWNPTVKSLPKAGAIDSMIPKLISTAGGKEDRIFLLSQNGRGGGRPQGDGPGPTMGGPNLQINPELIATRVQNMINRLPSDDRAEAQANFDTQRAFFQSLQGMTDEQRMAAIQQHMQDPNVQAQMAQRMTGDGRDGRMNHDQRMARFQNQVNRKLSAMGKM